MHIDWGQIVTHALGFIITVWLLKRYAWGHVLGFVEKRRETIAASFDEIEKGRTEVSDQKAQLEVVLRNTLPCLASKKFTSPELFSQVENLLAQSGEGEDSE